MPVRLSRISARRRCVPSCSRLLLTVLSLTLCSLGFSVNASGSTITVTNTSDSGTGSLRAAITTANANPGDTIVFASGLTGTITLLSTLPAITANLTITGPGANQLTISGNNSSTVGTIFTINSGVTASISGLTIAHGVGTCGGSSFDYGGGICVDDGTVTVDNDAFINNSANVGGGIYNQGTLTVSNSTFSGNSSTGNGAAIASAVTAAVTNSTFFSNSSTSGGGAGIFTEGISLTVANSTFDGNSSFAAGAALANISGTMSVANSILTANSQGGECFGRNGCPTNGSNGNIVGVSANLLPLGNYGGPTQTMLPLLGSAAICAGSSSDVPSGVTTDQRGFPLDTSCVDAGAVQTNYLTVNTNADSSDGSCTSTVCSLRDAIGAANSAGKGDIDFATSLNGQTITLASALPGLSGQENVVGTGANLLTVSGNNSATVGSVFVIDSGAQVTLDGLTIANGNSTTNGGGILNHGTLAIADCTFSGNAATDFGGGIAVDTGGSLTVTNSTFSGNSTTGGGTAGAGIYIQGTAVVTGSTFSGNSAVLDGGGIAIDTGGSLTVTNSTFSGNSTTSGGGAGIYTQGTSLVVTNSTFFGNSSRTAGAALANNAGTMTVANSILSEDNQGGECFGNGCPTNGSGGNVVGVAANLAALANYGGPTQTMLPLPNSPAICAGNKTGAPATDQRGFPTGAAAYCTSGKIDSGAVQTNYTSIQFTNAGTNGYAAAVNSDVAFPAAPIVSVTENSLNQGGVPVTLTFSGTGTATGLGPVTTAAGTGATFGSISVNEAGSGTLDAQLTPGSATLTSSADLKIVSITLTPATLPAATKGAPYSVAFIASGGSTSTYTFALTGTPPAGVTFNAAAATLSGTPTATGSFPLTVTATDSNGFSGSQSYTLTVNGAVVAALAIPSETLTYGAAANFRPVMGSGGTGTLSYSIFPSLPPGLSISSSTGAITGTPTATSPATAYTVTVTDANGATAIAGFLLVISKALPVVAWTSPASIAYGTPLSATQLDASASANGTAVPGSFTYIPALGTVLSAGPHTLTATFAPTDTTDYNTPAAVTTSITITQATLDVTANSASRAYGTANPTFSGTVTGAVNGDSFTESFTTTATPASNVGSYAIVPSVTGTNLSDYTVDTTDGALMVTQAGTTTTLMASASSLNPNQSLTLTAQVQSATIGTPTGSVNFYDGTTLLGAATLSGGSATLTTSMLTPGVTNSVTAAYQGSQNYAGSTSTTAVSVVVAPLDFTLTLESAPEAVTGGAVAPFNFLVSPTYGVYPGEVTFSASGLPTGATETFSPATVAANGGPQTVTMKVQTVPTTAQKDNPFRRGGAPLVLGFLLLPLLGTRRMRNSRLGRNLMLLLVITAGGIGLASLSGCGSNSGYQIPKAQDYTITVTATSGTVQHTFNVTLGVDANAF